MFNSWHYANDRFAPAAATQQLTPFRLYEQFANMARQAKGTRAMNIVGNQPLMAASLA
jgi:hypothetical protein